MSAADSSLIVAYSNADSNLAVAYGNADSSIDSRLASEESAEAAADTSLTTRLSNEEVAMASADTSMSSRISVEVANRSADISAAVSAVKDSAPTALDTLNELAVALGNDPALSTTISTSIASATTRIAAEESAEDAADTSLTTRLSSEEVSRAAADASLTTRLSNEEVVRASADSSLVVVYSAADASLATRLASEESAEDSADTSLTTRLSSEEVAMAAADSSLATDVSSAIVARSSAVSSVMNRFEQVSVNAATAGNFDSNGEKSLTINHSFGNEKALFAMVYVDDVMQMAPVSYNNGSITVDLAGSASGAVCSSDVKVNLVKVVNYSVVTSNLELHLDAGNSSSYSGSGTTWSDLSSNGYDFTLAGSPSHDSGDGSFVFDGNSKRASNSDSISISTGALELWIKVDNDGATGGRVALQGSSHWVSTGDVTGTYNDESLEFNHNSGPTMDYRNGHADFADGTWRHIVSVVDGSDNKLYVDGVAVSTDFRIGNATSTSGKLWDGSAHTIGGFSNGSYTFHGEIAVVRMYSGSFSAANVLNNYNADKARFGH